MIFNYSAIYFIIMIYLRYLIITLLIITFSFLVIKSSNKKKLKPRNVTNPKSAF